ncbi:LHFPL tetraspan subfamily member 7 protein [Pelodytes ibericus]
MVSFMGFLWLILSLVLPFISGISLMSPAWFRNGDFSFGVLVQCHGPINAPCNQTCIIYKNLEEIPDVFLKISAVILFSGWLLLSFGAVLVLSWTVIPAGLCQRRVCTPARYSQTAAVSITVLGLLIFPFSLSSPFAKQICISSFIYMSGKCSLGWGYMMAIITVLLSCFLPIIGRYNLNEIKTKILRTKITRRMASI